LYKVCILRNHWSLVCIFVLTVTAGVLAQTPGTPTRVASVRLSEEAATNTGGAGDADASPFTIRLVSGRIIHADTVTNAGKKIEFTIGEAVYELPKVVILHIDSRNVPTTPSQAAAAPNSRGAATPAPLTFAEDPRNWYLYESIQQLREECRSSQFVSRLYAEFQSKAHFPITAQEAKATCDALALDMGADYERTIDRMVELVAGVCKEYGTAARAPKDDPAMQEYFQVSRSLRMDSGHSQDKLKEVRYEIDLSRVAANCGAWTVTVR
jgi:hypothetical protein